MQSDSAGIVFGDDGPRLIVTKDEQNRRIELGLCPNGCGPMIRRDEHTRDCQRCGFGYWRK